MLPVWKRTFNRAAATISGGSRTERENGILHEEIKRTLPVIEADFRGDHCIEALIVGPRRR